MYKLYFGFSYVYIIMRLTKNEVQHIYMSVMYN